VSASPTYTEFYPQLYRKRMGTLWWLHRRSYLVFVLRELSCVFIAWFVIFLLLLVHAIGAGDHDYHRFLNWAANPWVIAVNIVAMLFVVLHAVTWFNLAPKAIVVRARGRRVPASLIAGANYLAWVVVSGVVAWLILRT
jgi:fumarate reductase subunit C